MAKLKSRCTRTTLKLIKEQFLTLLLILRAFILANSINLLSCYTTEGSPPLLI
jgi:hypothetical protein